MISRQHRFIVLINFMLSGIFSHSLPHSMMPHISAGTYKSSGLSNFKNHLGQLLVYKWDMVLIKWKYLTCNTVTYGTHLCCPWHAITFRRRAHVALFHTAMSLFPTFLWLNHNEKLQKSALWSLYRKPTYSFMPNINIPPGLTVFRII